MPIDPQLLLAFLAAATVLTITPGPDTMLVLASSTTGGPRAGVAATLGIATSLVLHAALAALGISALVAASPVAFDVLRIAGALYLLWIGLVALYQFLAGLTNVAPPQTALAKPALWSAYQRGVLSNALNPKVIIFYIAFLPQFANPELGNVPLQIFVLGTIHNAIGLVWLFALSVVSGRTAQAFSQNRRVRTWLDGLAGSIYILLAVRMLMLERKAG